jgi:hypothetical protein
MPLTTSVCFFLRNSDPYGSSSHQCDTLAVSEHCRRLKRCVIPDRCHKHGFQNNCCVKHYEYDANASLSVRSASTVSGQQRPALRTDGKVVANYGSKDYSSLVTDETLRLFASKNFMRLARRFGSDGRDLWEAVHEKPDADLGGSVFKFRLARRGEGTSGGARAIVAMKSGRRIVLMYGFEKKDLANIRADELKQFKASAKIYLGFSEEQISDLLERQVLTEIKPRGTSGTKRDK